MGKSAYPAGRRIAVVRTAPLLGSPRVRTSGLRPGGSGKSPFTTDRFARTGVNVIGTDHVWGARVAPVTGRKSNKRPGWTSKVAGGSHIIAPGV